MTGRQAPPRDDRVLFATRALSIAIIPFLLVAFVVLFFAPTDTGRWFAWTIKPSLTPMLLGSVYLGGAYFFARAARATQWHRIKGGFIPVATFASLMGIATLLHWEKFNHDHVAFWLWAGLYFTTPFLVAGVYLANRRYDAPGGGGQLSPPLRGAIAAVGVLAAGTSALLFLAPARAIEIWPWLLTPLTARVMGAIFALGIAAIGVLLESRRSSTLLMVEVASVMLVLIAIGAFRGRRDVDESRPLSWMFGVGFIAVITCCLAMLLGERRRGRSAGTNVGNSRSERTHRA
ncbi:MAG: hypothetical protein ABIM89_11745 [Mycobacteriales bacterium]